jgi:hypothetical protein
MMQRESKMDDKTAKLRALRLAKEQAEKRSLQARKAVRVVEQPQVPVVQCQRAAAQQAVQSEIPLDEEIPF